MLKKTALSPLPEDIIFSILTRLPAEFLHNHGRFVCKTWSAIINDPMFIKAQALLSKSGLFFQYCLSESPARFAEVKKQKIEVTEVGGFLAGKYIVGSSAGVVLLRSKSRSDILYVANPATNQISPLPRLSPRGHALSIAYMPHTGEIKVICHVLESRAYKPYVLTVGRNMVWKEMEAKPNIPPVAMTCCGNSIFSLDGVVYYTGHDLKEQTIKLYANDLADETIHNINLPGKMSLKFYRIISTGKSLLLIYRPPSSSANEATTWKLKDFKKSEWVKSGRLKIEENSRFLSFSQVGRVENSEIIFYCSRWQWPATVNSAVREVEEDVSIVAYDGRNGKSVGSWRGSQTSAHNFLVHSPTLISW